MKVESSNDVQAIPRVDQPAVRDPVVAASATDQLGQLFSQEVTANSRELSKRSIGLRVPPVKEIAQLYEQLGHPAQAALAVIARRIRQQLLKHPGVDELLKQTEGDPARMYVVLKHVANQADTEARPSEAALARDAIAKLEVRYKGQIQAGLNIAQTLQAACGDPQERQALRTLYYASVVTRQSLAVMMQALLGVYGGEGLMKGLTLMRRALADDIAANLSSVDKSMLRRLLMGLSSCSQLSGVLSNCQALIHRLGVEHDPVGLLQRLLGYASTGIAVDEIMRLVGDVRGNHALRELVALNALYPVVQQLPQALWLDSRSRQEALHSFLLVMDELTKAERGLIGFAGERAGA